MKLSKFHILILLLIFLLGFVLRFYDLSRIPPGVHGDEAEFGLIEQKIIKGNYTSFFSLGDTGPIFSFSVLSFWVQGVFQMIFDNTVFGIRVSSALVGAITVLIFYLTAKQFFKNKFISLLTTFAFATSHYHIAYSRLALSNAWTPFFLVTIFYFFYKALQEKEKRMKLYSFTLAGLFLGLSQYFHFTTRAIPIIFLLIGLISLFYTKNRKQLLLFLGIFFLVAGIIFFPQMLYYLNHWSEYTGRMDTVSIFNHLPEYYDRYHVKSVFAVLFWQFVNTLKGFILGGDIGFYIYGYQGGLLAPIVAVLVTLGVFISFLKIKLKKYQFLLIWFFAIIILGGTVTIDAPSSTRLVGTIPVLFLLAGVAVEKLLQIRIKYLKGLLIIFFIFNGFWDYKIYFVDYIHSQAGWAQREPATQIAYYLQSLGPNWKVYVLNEEFWYSFQHGTVKFLNPGLEGEDIDVSESVIPNKVLTAKNIVYIMPQNSPSLNRLREHYPQGKKRDHFNSIGKTPSFTSYEVRNSMLK